MESSCQSSTHPFPLLVNKSLNFIVELEGIDAFGRDSGLAIIPAPRLLPRIIKVPEEVGGPGDNYVFLSSMIHAHADDLFQEALKIDENNAGAFYGMALIATDVFASTSTIWPITPCASMTG